MGRVQTASTRRCGLLPSLRTGLLTAALACVVAAGLAVAPPAAEASAGLPPHRTTHSQPYIIEPALTGPQQHWDACLPGTASGQSRCGFMQSTGPHTAPVNCAVWDFGPRVGGALHIRVFVPHRRATATVTYSLTVVDADDGEVHHFQSEVAQIDVSGWASAFRIINARASSMVMTACNNSAAEAAPAHAWAYRLIAADAAEIICWSACDFVPVRQLGAHAKLTGLIASPHPPNRLELRWHRRPGRTPTELVGYRIAYTGDGLAEDTIYETWDEFHFSPPLTLDSQYRVRVWEVDMFGRQGAAAVADVHLPSDAFDPPPGPGWIEGSARWVRNLLDAVGVVDPTFISDGLSAVVSLSLGEPDQAAWSVVAIVPYVGDASKARKLGRAGAGVASLRGTEALELSGLNKKQRKLVDKARGGKPLGLNTVSVGSARFTRDAYGRVTSAGGPLKWAAAGDETAKSATRRALKHLKRKRSDDMGHLLPRSMGGPFTLDNVVLQSRSVNRLINTHLEQKIWEPALRAGRKVDVRIDVIYDASNHGMRPDRFRVRSLVDGHQRTSHEIANTSGAQLVNLRP